MKKVFLIIVLAFCAGFGAAAIWNNREAEDEPALIEQAVPTEQTEATPEAEQTAADTAKETQTPQPTEAAAEPVEKTAAINDFSKYNSLNSTAVGWGFKKNKGKAPDISESIQKMLEENNGYYMDKTQPRALYLTFDEGYENGYTAQILDVLKKTQVPAAFFVTGPYLKKETELVGRMINEGHIVGNHTVNHPNLAKAGVQKAAQELSELNDIYYEQYGQNMKYMRPPEGEYSEQILSLAKDMGYKTVLWSFAYRDWEVDNQKGADYAFESVTPYLHDGAIILLHAVSADNANALESIINYAKGQGYEFRSLDQLT